MLLKDCIQGIRFNLTLESWLKSFMSSWQSHPLWVTLYVRNIIETTKNHSFSRIFSLLFGIWSAFGKNFIFYLYRALAYSYKSSYLLVRKIFSLRLLGIYIYIWNISKSYEYLISRIIWTPKPKQQIKPTHMSSTLYTKTTITFSNSKHIHTYIPPSV